MDKYINALSGHTTGSRNGSVKKASFSTSFASQLEAFSGKKSSLVNGADSGERILVGEISRNRQTVSELLMHNKELKSSTWNILSSAANRNRDYTRLTPGTKVYYNSNDGSLTWSGTDVPALKEITAQPAAAPVFPGMTAPVQFVEESAPVHGVPGGVELGVISRQEPTVSHLLKAHPEFGNETWTILSSTINKNKDFSRLPVGAVVTIDPATREIGWQTGGAEGAAAQPVQNNSVAAPVVIEKTQPEKSISPQPENTTAAAGVQAGDLTEAVRPFFGRHYKEINCYELLVKGLERMNIPYSGKDGLFTKLTRMAKEQGLPANAYLNGEGVVKAAGSLVLSKNYPHTSNWKRDAENLYEELEPLLNKGQILSFSTRRRGHTGIVSQQDRQWTFINSGRLDNSLTEGSPKQGVGEENLREEIRNWFKLASKSGESLSVTLGNLGQERVVTALNTELPTPGRRRI